MEAGRHQRSCSDKILLVSQDQKELSVPAGVLLRRLTPGGRSIYKHRLGRLSATAKMAQFLITHVEKDLQGTFVHRWCENKPIGNKPHMLCVETEDLRPEAAEVCMDLAVRECRRAPLDSECSRNVMEKRFTISMMHQCLSFGYQA